MTTTSSTPTPSSSQALEFVQLEQLAAVQSPEAAPPDSFEVRVLDEDNDLGQRCNAWECRFSRAIKRALVLMGFWPKFVCVGPSRITGFSRVSVGFGSEPTTQFRFDDHGQIDWYDRGGNPPPCTVTLRRAP